MSKMLALFPNHTYYSQNYSGIIYLPLLIDTSVKSSIWNSSLEKVGGPGDEASHFRRSTSSGSQQI